MQEYISCASHKHYPLAEREDAATGRSRQARIDHVPGAIRRYLEGVEPGTPVAVEAIGSWYWIVDEIEQAGCRPLLVHPRKAKVMMGQTNKTDKLDVHGLNRLQRTGTLPWVWIPPADLRDLRELTRMRIAVVRERTRLKNRIQATLAKYGLQIRGVSDLFGRAGRRLLARALEDMAPQARWTTELRLEHLDVLDGQIRSIEKKLEGLIELSAPMQRLRSLPGVGIILAATIVLEVGDGGRFGRAEDLASYAGTTPRVHASGGKVRYGTLRSDVNRTLKWAFAEAANSVAVNRRRRPERFVSRRYAAIRRRRNHAVAVGAVARHLAEACFYVLSKEEEYREPETPKARGRAREA